MSDGSKISSSPKAGLLSNQKEHVIILKVKELFIYGGIFLTFYFFLSWLLKLAKKNLRKPRPKLKRDDFYNNYGYSYELVFVYPVLSESEKSTLTSYQKKYSLKNNIDRIQAAGLETKCFYSCQRDEIYVKIRGKPDRLLKEAHRIEYKLELDEQKIKIKLGQGKKEVVTHHDRNTIEEPKYKWAGVEIKDEQGVSSYDPHKHIYGPYKENQELQNLYKATKSDSGHDWILKEVDRIKLIISILQAKLSESPPGAGLNIDELMEKEVIYAAFPVHNYDELSKLQGEWLKMTASPSAQPIDKIKNYFGERIGLYFWYLQHYVESLAMPALLGLIVFLSQVVIANNEDTFQPYFTLYMVIWNTFFIERWKQKQSTIAMKWGVQGFEQDEQDRPQFHGKKIISSVNNKEETYFPRNSSQFRSNVVNALLVVCILVVIGVIAFIYYCERLAEQAFGRNFPSGFEPIQFITAVANAIVISVTDILFLKIVPFLNDFENHRTQTQYEDNLIFKIFLFKMVNSYSSLLYIAFIKQFIGLFCVENDCTTDVSITIEVLFIIDLLSRAYSETVVQLYLQDRKNKEETDGLEPGKQASVIEQQYILAEYPVLMGTLKDYAGLISQYGYAVMFVAAFPVGTTLAFISSFIQIRIDGWKLCQAYRRPQPRTAEDIGVWQDMLEIVSVFAVITNIALLCFTGKYLLDYTWTARWIVFFAFEHILIVSKFILAEIIDDVPEEVQMQLDRQDFIVSKVIFNTSDEVAPELDDDDKLQYTIKIAKTDFEWDLPEEDIDDDDDDDEDKDDEEKKKNDNETKDNNEINTDGELKKAKSKSKEIELAKKK